MFEIANKLWGNKQAEGLILFQEQNRHDTEYTDYDGDITIFGMLIAAFKNVNEIRCGVAISQKYLCNLYICIC